MTIGRFLANSARLDTQVLQRLPEHFTVKLNSLATAHEGWKVFASNAELVAQALQGLSELFIVKPNSHATVHERWTVHAS